MRIKKCLFYKKLICTFILKQYQNEIKCSYAFSLDYYIQFFQTTTRLLCFFQQNSIKDRFAIDYTQIIHFFDGILLKKQSNMKVCPKSQKNINKYFFIRVNSQVEYQFPFHKHLYIKVSEIKQTKNMKQFSIIIFVDIFIFSLFVFVFEVTADYNIFITYIMDQQSKTEQVITRNNYLIHKQKLHEIKNNAHNTSLQFYSAAKARPLDRKKILLLKMKREEIEQQNQYLRKKIEKINHTTTNQQFRRKLVSENENRKTSQSVAYHLGDFKRKQRYDKEEDTNKMEVNSDCGDGDSIKCFIPPLKNKIKFTSISQSKATDYNAIIFNLRQKEKSGLVKEKPVHEQQQKQKQINIQDNPEGIQNKDNNLVQKQRSPSITMLQNPKIKQAIRNSTALSKDELLYNEPQKEAHRIVLFKKTKIPYPMVSFLIEISLIDKRLLIIAYGMGIISQDYKLLISRKRSRQISEEVKGNYEILWERVEVDLQSGIRIAGLYEYQEGTQLDTFQNQIQKQKVMQQKRYEITQDFLQRNYYTLLKQQVNAKTKQENSIPITHKQKSPVNNTNQQKNRLKSVLKYKIEYKGKQDMKSQEKQVKQIKVKEKKTQGKTMEARKQGRASETKIKQKQDIKIKRINNIKTNPSNNTIKNDTKQIHTKPAQKSTQLNKSSTTNTQKNPSKKLAPLQQEQNYQQQFQQNFSKQSPSIKKTNGKSNLINKSNEYEEEIENYSEDFSHQINEQEYPQQFVNEYSMEYESNPSKIIENKSLNSNMNKKKQMKNSSKVSGIEQQYSEFNQYEEVQSQNPRKQEKKKQKSKIIQKTKKQQIQQQYIDQFES